MLLLLLLFKFILLIDCKFHFLFHLEMSEKKSFGIFFLFFFFCCCCCFYYKKWIWLLLWVVNQFISKFFGFLFFCWLCRILSVILSVPSVVFIECCFILSLHFIFFIRKNEEKKFSTFHLINVWMCVCMYRWWFRIQILKLLKS